jgi:hypothetical protein
MTQQTRYWYTVSVPVWQETVNQKMSEQYEVMDRERATERGRTTESANELSEATEEMVANGERAQEQAE